MHQTYGGCCGPRSADSISSCFMLPFELVIFLNSFQIECIFCWCVALLQQEGGETLLLSVRNLGCSCAIEKQPSPQSVGWIRRIPCAQVNTQYFSTVLCAVLSLPLSYNCLRHKEDTDRCIGLKMKFLNILKNVVKLYSLYGKFVDPFLFPQVLSWSPATQAWTSRYRKGMEG